jgi:ligand-binding sensor domain-containing protein
LFASLGAGASETAAQTSRFWRPDERVVLSDFTAVRALAGTRGELFVATDLGLLVYDHIFRRWLPPYTYLDGYPTRSVTVALADPADGSVWLGTRSGLYHYRHRSGVTDSLAVPGGVFDLMFDADASYDGIYVRNSRGWSFLPRGAFMTRSVGALPRHPVRTVSVEGVLNRFPVLDAARAQLLVDDRLRLARYTSAFLLPGGERVVMGTDAIGAFVAEPLISQFEALDFGLVGTGAGAVTVAAGEIWTGSIGPGPRIGFTRLSEDLQSFEFDLGPRAVGFNFTHVRDLLIRRGNV